MAGERNAHVVQMVARLRLVGVGADYFRRLGEASRFGAFFVAFGLSDAT